MKALLVADDEKAINNISEVLKAAGYDPIVYKWLLKALDNIEEVAPHLIIVSTADYPRHWKTLAQYASTGFGDYAPELILYTDENFSEEEKKKAEALHVRGYFNSVGVEGLDQLREILTKTDDIYSGSLADEEQNRIGITTEDEKAAEKLQELADDERAADKLERISGNEEIEIPTVADILSEPYDAETATGLPGEEELKKLLEEVSEKTDFEDSENDDTISVDSTGENTMADEQSIDEKLAAIMNANKADAKEKAEALNLDTGSNSVSFVFTNPITLAMVSGVARNYNGLVLEFTPDIPSFILNLSPGTKIDIASIKTNDKIENVFAEVMSNDTKKLALAIKK